MYEYSSSTALRGQAVAYAALWEQTWGVRILQASVRGVHRHGAFQTAIGRPAGWAPVLSALRRKLSLCTAQ